MKKASTIFLLLISFNTTAQLLLHKLDSIQVVKHDKVLKMPWAGGINSVNIQTADLDGDAVKEVILYDRMADLPYIFQHTKNGLIARDGLRHLLPDIDFHSWLMFADIDCDGDKDLFTNSSLGIVIYEHISENGRKSKWQKLASPLLTTGYSGKINLVVNGDDVPVIEDIDGDGDVDILAFNFAVGGTIHYYKNMAVEQTGSCNDFDFVIESRKWGGVEECDCFEYAFGDESCNGSNNGGRSTHEGGNSLMVIDNDYDGDMDLLMGHSTCKELVYFENMGTPDSAVFTDFKREVAGFSGKTGLLYPASYFADTNNDGVKELHITSNLAITKSTDNDYGKSVIKYENVPTDGGDFFELTEPDYIQGGMLDFGASSVPVGVDVDGDFDQDILVASTGHQVDGKYYASINLLINTGNRFRPSFKVGHTNFLELSTRKITHPRIALADFDADGVQDLFVSGFVPEKLTVASYIYFGDDDSSNEYLFHPDDFKMLNIDLKAFDSPVFYDVDKDGDQDMILGRRDGSLKLYENTGREHFKLKEEEFVGIGRDFTLSRLYLFPAVADINGDNKADLITADMSELKVYYDFTESSDSQPDTLLYSNEFVGDDVKLVAQQINSLTFIDLFGMGSGTMLMGGITGGLTMYNVMDEQKTAAQQLEILAFPNPVDDAQILKVLSSVGGVLDIFDMAGRKVSQHSSESGVFKIDMSKVNSGVYIFKFISVTGEVVSEKVIKR